MGKKSAPGKGYDLPAAAWRQRAFTISHVAALALIGSWVLPATRQAWDRIDVAVFLLLNDSLALSEWWQVFWAVANVRAIDLLSGSLAACVVAWWLWRQPARVQQGRLAVVCSYAVILLCVAFTAHLVIKYVTEFERYSPTIVFKDSLRISQLVPYIKAKDLAAFSFPGDHAFFLTAIVLMYGYIASRKFVAASIILGLMFSVPRLVSGAHWLTDLAVGGVASALIVAAWFFATPAAHYAAKLLLPPVRFVMERMPVWLPFAEEKGAPEYRR